MSDVGSPLLLPDSFQPALPLAVAYSGGADSTALLLACSERWPGQVQAIHVHHGLQAAADDFASHCKSFCTRLEVTLHIRMVQAAAARGESPENAARIARYEAFAAAVLAQPSEAAIKTIVLAQHSDDQVETLLLALSRGAGLGGLSAMPQTWSRDGIIWWRPLLAMGGGEIRRWLAARGLRAGVDWVEDPTNADERFTRNRIRARLLPALEEAFPHFRITFARSAAHAAQAQALLAELAAADRDAVQTPHGRCLAIAAIQRFSRARQANLLRFWVKEASGFAPTTVQLNELLDQIAACTTRGHAIHLKAANGHVRRDGASLVFEPLSARA